MTHPLEWIFLGTSIVSLLATGFVFTLKLSDLLLARSEGVNGPITYMKRDNIRQQAFFMAFSAGMIALAVSSLNNVITPSSQTLNLLTGLICGALMLTADSLFMYRRRGKLAELVGKYERRQAQAIPGGKRSYDPPLPIPANNNREEPC